MMQQWHHLLALLGSHYSASELVLDVCWVSLWCSPTLNSLVTFISFVAHTQLQKGNDGKDFKYIFSTIPCVQLIQTKPLGRCPALRIMLFCRGLYVPPARCLNASDMFQSEFVTTFFCIIYHCVPCQDSKA